MTGSDLPEAVVVVLRREGRVLVVRRGPEAPMAGYWAPVSGRIESGEHQEDAVVREVREEVGLRATPIGKVWEGTTHDGRYRLHWWLAEGEPGEPELDPREVADAKWIDPAEFPSLAPTFESHRRFFADVFPDVEAGSPEQWHG